MSRLARLVVVGLCLALLVGAAAAAPATVSIDAPSTVESGETVTVSLTLTNTGDSEDFYLLNVSAPDSWSVVDHSDDGGEWQDADSQWIYLSVDAGTSVQPSVTLQVPNNADTSATVDVRAKNVSGVQATGSHSIGVRSDTTNSDGDDSSSSDESSSDSDDGSTYSGDDGSSYSGDDGDSDDGSTYSGDDGDNEDSSSSDESSSDSDDSSSSDESSSDSDDGSTYSGDDGDSDDGSTYSGDDGHSDASSTESPPTTPTGGTETTYDTPGGETEPAQSGDAEDTQSYSGSDAGTPDDSNPSYEAGGATATPAPVDASNNAAGPDQSSADGGLFTTGLGVGVGLFGALLLVGIGVVTFRRDGGDTLPLGGDALGGSDPDGPASETDAATTDTDLSAVGDALAEAGIGVVDLEAGQTANTLSYTTAAEDDMDAKVEIRTIIRSYLSATSGDTGRTGLEATILDGDETLGTWHIRGEWLDQLEAGSLSLAAFDENVFETVNRTD